MFIIGNFIYAIAIILNYILEIAKWLIIIRALISWVNPDPFNVIVQFLYKTTEPILTPFRRVFPTHTMGIDISPIFAFLLIFFMQLFVVRTLFALAARMG